MRARGHGAGRRARYRCIAERATARKARVLHARAWNLANMNWDVCDALFKNISETTAVLPNFPHSNFCKRVPNRPLRPRGGRCETLLLQLECGNFRRTAVSHKEILISHTGSIVNEYSGRKIVTVFGMSGRRDTCYRRTLEIASCS